MTAAIASTPAAGGLANSMAQAGGIETANEWGIGRCKQLNSGRPRQWYCQVVKSTAKGKRTAGTELGNQVTNEIIESRRVDLRERNRLVV